jgi:hypothetical protein
MLSQIYTQIFKADLIIADMSSKNPNVFYEVGYAHGISKNVVLITDNADDIPFDFKHYQHIVYNKNNLNDLKSKLLERIKFYITSNSLHNVDFNQYIISIESDEIDENKKYIIKPNFDDETTVIFNIDFHNPTEQIIIPDCTSVNLIMPKKWINYESSTYPVLDKKNVLMNICQMPSLNPFEYSSEQICIDKNELDRLQYYNEFTEIIFRIISRFGYFDKKIFIKFEKR